MAGGVIVGTMVIIHCLVGEYAGFGNYLMASVYCRQPHIARLAVLFEPAC